MNRRNIVALGAGSVLSLSSCSRTDASPSQKQELKKVLDAFFERAKVKDWESVGKLFAGSFAIFTDGATSFDRSAYIALLKDDDIELRTMELRNLEFDVSPDGRMGWCRYRGYFVTASHGKPSTTETAETLIFGNDGGGWKITHAHASIKTLPESAKS